MRDVERRETTDDLDALMEALPPEICDRLSGLANRTDLLEVVMDLGRRPQARFTTGEQDLLDREITEADIAHVIDHIGVFGDDNRAGIERTLHRISAIRNRVPGKDIRECWCLTRCSVVEHAIIASAASIPDASSAAACFWLQNAAPRSDRKRHWTYGFRSV